MFYKIIQDNKIIDVNNQFFRTQKKPHLLIECEPKYCEYVCSSDGLEFYYSDWTREAQFPFSFAQRVDQIVIIEEDEYNSLKEQLCSSETILTTPTEEDLVTNSLPIEQEEIDVVEVMDNASLKRKILELEELVKQLLNK